MSDSLEARFDAQGREWRDPAAVVAQWSDLCTIDPALLAVRARGGWWEALEAAGVTLIVSREYEHLLLAIAARGRDRISYLRLPHPSGIAFDSDSKRLFVASTRNPNNLVEFARVSGALPRGDIGKPPRAGSLVPIRSSYLPGCTYLHDLAIVGGKLYGNAVGQNTVVGLDGGVATAAWWPRSVDRNGAPVADRNLLQLNSIAAGADLASSFFSASGERPGRYRPGHLKYPVDRRGVVFSGATREPIVRGLTRPHSARLQGDRLWVADSGYGEVGSIADGRFEPVARLPGWTRGLAFARGIAFAGTSRVIPRFRHYAPGVDDAHSRCAIHAIELATGRVLGTLEFPGGNQIFAIEPIPADWSDGFAFRRATRPEAIRRLFYAFTVDRKS